jgi:alpha-tubulin suppressor-like RCC1 family protein
VPAKCLIAIILTAFVSGCTAKAKARPTEVWGWGENAVGQVGDGSTIRRPTPVKLPGLEDVTTLTAGRLFSMVLRADGGVWQWGRLPDSTSVVPTATATPVRVVSRRVGTSPGVPLENVTRIAVGGRHALARMGTDIVGWGDNDFAQLGRDLPKGSIDAVPVSVNPGRLIALATGDFHSLALQAGPPTQTVWAWGSSLPPAKFPLPGGFGGRVGSLGVPTPDSCGFQFMPGTTTLIPCRFAPAQVPNLVDVIDIAVGSEHSVVVKTDGTVWAWGENEHGQLGVGFSTLPFTATPVQITGVPDLGTIAPLKNVQLLAAGAFHTLALTWDGRVWSWGENHFGQLGHSSAAARMVVGPTGTDFLRDVIAIAAGGDHSLAITKDGKVWAWGDNQHGQLGTTVPATCGFAFTPQGLTPCSTKPVLVATIPGARTVAAGERHSLVLASP